MFLQRPISLEHIYETRQNTKEANELYACVHRTVCRRLFALSPPLSFPILCTVPTLYSLSFTSNVSYAISPLPINAKLDACCQRSLALMECMVIICNQDNALRSLHCSLERKKKKREKKEKEKEKVCCTFTYATSS